MLGLGLGLGLVTLGGLPLVPTVTCPLANTVFDFAPLLGFANYRPRYP